MRPQTFVGTAWSRPVPRPGYDGGMKVLLVEDTKTSAKFIDWALRKGGYETRIAVHGYQALHFLKTEPDIAAAVIDLMMPRMDGFELVQWIRDSGLKCGVVICTSSREPDTLRRLGDLDVKYFVSKPVHGALLLEKVAAAAREASGLEPTPAPQA